MSDTGERTSMSTPDGDGPGRLHRRSAEMVGHFGTGDRAAMSALFGEITSAQEAQAQMVSLITLAHFTIDRWVPEDERERWLTELADALVQAEAAIDGA